MTQLWRVDDGRFPSETLDGETVVIDTVTGQVVVFGGVASVVWEVLRVGVDVDRLASSLRSRYGSDCEPAVTTFLEALRDGRMVVRVDDAEELPDDIAWPATFDPPVLERFDDLANLLTVDPIHDVDRTAGWPRAE